MSAPCLSQSDQELRLTTQVQALQSCFALPPPAPFTENLPLQQCVQMFWS